MLGASFQANIGDGPLVAAAIHDGHALRPEVERLLVLGEQERLREEDPYTGRLTDIAPTRVIGLRSRFEMDLNRPREKAVYSKPEDCWGLRVWSEPPPPEVTSRSLANYDAFRNHVERMLESLLQRHGRFIVLDLHSYNHRREGPHAPAADPALNPEINIGTGSADRRRWGAVIDGFMERLARFDYLGRRLDVRENVKFQGGDFPQWIHRRFAGEGLTVAIELKKFWMDEWTAELDAVQFDALHAALRSAAAGLEEARPLT